MIVDKSSLSPYVEQRADLIPLHVWNKQIKNKKGTIVERGKTPLDNNWTRTEKNLKRTIEKAKKGFNVGYRIGEQDLIIDVDPRNFGDASSLDDLHEFLKLDDLADHCPTVITGSGGYHYYMKIPKGLHIRETIEQFPGIEFKTKGRQVVAAGSKHPNGKFYEWDEFSPKFGTIFKAPKKLLKLLAYKPAQTQANADTVTPHELQELLIQLPIDSYSDNDSWFKILCAAHHGTGGKGIDEFLDWSLSDLDYADDEHLIRCRWTSLAEKANSITVNTLYKEVLAHGGNTAISATTEFKDFADDEPLDEDFDDISEEGELEKGYKDGLALQLAENLRPNSTDEDLIKAIRASLQAGDIEQIKAQKVIQNNVGINKADLNKLIKKLTEQLKNDLGRILAEKTRKIQFYKGEGLVFNNNAQFWAYNGMYWHPITRAYVGLKVTATLDKLRKKIKDLNIKENTIVTEAVSILERLTATSTDVLKLRDKPRPVINCQNGELWIDKDGVGKLRPHTPKSYLTYVLDVEYTPGASCPLFEKSIRNTFSNFDDCEDIVRHFEEYMGYVLHPDKRPAKWWLFKGPGGDGKTTLMKILSGLLGDAVLPESIEKFTTGGDNHATSNLVGKLLVYDDDLNRNTLLPDGALKQLSEDGLMTANPKGQQAFRFNKVCTVTMLSNGYPKTRDLTRGFRRRAMVIPFDRSFHDGDAIVDLADQIISEELAGVLNKALNGLQRLRGRGNFKEPKSCIYHRDLWINESNIVALFLNEKVTVTDDITDQVKLNDMYAEFGSWCGTHGVTHKQTKQQFRGVIEDLGIWYGTLAGNSRGFKCVKLIEEEIDLDDFEDFDELD